MSTPSDVSCTGVTWVVPALPPINQRQPAAADEPAAKRAKPAEANPRFREDKEDDEDDD